MANLVTGEILVVGVGGGGTNALSNMAFEWTDGPGLVAVHTDAEVLAVCAAHQQVQIGESVTEGFSSGGDPEIGRKAAESDETKLRALFSQVRICFLVTGLGGGTGTGAAPVVARLAREERALVIAFAALPFAFEGGERRKTAERGLYALKEAAHIVIAMPNDRILSVNPEAGLIHAFKQSDDVIQQAVRSIWIMLTHTGVINLDFSDIQNMGHHSEGVCALSCVRAGGENRVAEVIEKLLCCPNLERGHILSQARGLVIGILGGPGLTLSEVQRIMTEFHRMVPGNAKIHFGIGVDEDLSDQISLTVLASEIWIEKDVKEVAEDPNQTVMKFKMAGAGGKPSSKEKKVIQTSLDLEPAGKGRFKDVEPTYYDGQDLDYPAFMRRGIKLSKSYS